ncbi:MAG: hypothetical protein Q8P46_14305 [Hyphomicrobiales bacterium]|nr:hypothetical protein [Hyphomicrobiales bacterium]
MAMDVEAEIRDLKRRVSELEGSFGFLTEQVKGVHRDLLGFRERTEQRFDQVEAEIREVREETRQIRQETRQLRDDMPGIVGDAVREVLREGKGS